MTPKRLSGRATVVALVVLGLAGCGMQGASTTAGSTSGRSAPGTGGSARSGAGTSAHAAGASHVPGGNWLTFDYNAERSGVGPLDTGITAANVGALRRRVIRLPGTVDSSPVEMHALKIGGRRRDVVFVTTSYGISLAIDPSTGHRLWTYVPGGTSALEGSPQITTATPVIDPNRRYIYTASPNGFIHKLSIRSGRPVWSRSVTTNPRREKIEGALNIDGGAVIAVTGGYNGDAPPYQGHVALISRRTGRITHVWNSLCSNRPHLIDPTSSCPASDSAIWGRSGSVVEPWNGHILVATGNGPFNGTTNWGDSVLELSLKLHLLHNWTPTDQSGLNQSDGDLGSTEPAILPVSGGLHLALQGGKDDILRLLDLDRLDGTTQAAGARTGGQLQSFHGPGSAAIVAEPAVWRHAGHTYVFVTDGAGTAAYELGGNARLFRAWSDGIAGTSPIVAGGLLYAYDPSGQVIVRNPVTGHVLASLPASSGHWNSPIVVGGRVIAPTGNDNDHLTSGSLYVFHLPGR